MEQTANRELTFGEKAVGITFNPGGMEEVNTIKKISADLLMNLTGKDRVNRVEKKQPSTLWRSVRYRKGKCGV